MPKKTKDQSQMKLFVASEAPAALAASSSACTDSVKGDKTCTENSEPAANSGVPEIPATDLKTTAISTGRDSAEGPIATEPIIMTADPAPVAVIRDTNTGIRLRSSVPEDVIAEAATAATADAGGDSGNDARSLEIPSGNPEAASMGDLTLAADNNSERRPVEDCGSSSAEILTQEPASSAPETVGQATCQTTNKQSDVGKAQQNAAKLKGPKKPSRKPLLPISTGAEPMQARAVTLYAALASAAEKSELEMHSPGSPVPLSSAVLDTTKNVYLAHDDKYQRTLAAHAGNPALLEKDEHLAGDRARKLIERAMDDLIEMGAVQTDADGNPITLQRLPDIKRVLAESGAVTVRCCSGGKRQLCDADGNNIHAPLNMNSRLADKLPGQNDQAA